MLIAVPLQVVLGLVFAALAYPAMIVAEYVAAIRHSTTRSRCTAATRFDDPMVLSLWLASFVSFIPTYGFGLALVTGSSLYTRFRNLELQRSALEREWSAARLAALRMQLSPHTLFNLLHTIRGHIEWDPKSAQTMVVQLADLLRRLLNAGERDFSRLADELQFVRLYLELQQKRFADRLTIKLPPARGHRRCLGAEPDPAAAGRERGGSRPRRPPGPGRGARRGRRRRTRRWCCGSSNTIAPGKTAGTEGIGLNNVRERLAVQFEGRARLVGGTLRHGMGQRDHACRGCMPRRIGAARPARRPREAA